MPRCLFALWAALSASAVCAQVTGSVGVVSDDRFRGVSLSDAQPALQLDLDAQGGNGWYAGGFASSIRIARPAAQVVAYFGRAWRAWRANADWNWDAGFAYARFGGRARDYSYPEIYIGATHGDLAARLSYSNDYFGQHRSSLYAELNATHAFTRRLRWLGHLGVLRSGADHYRGDARIGLGFDVAGFDVQAARTFGAGSGVAYPLYGRAVRAAWVFGVTRAW